MTHCSQTKPKKPPKMSLFLVFTVSSLPTLLSFIPSLLPSTPAPQALSLNISRARATESLLASTRAASFSGHLPSRLRKYPQEGALSSLTASSNQAKALLASLSASSFSAEALLLSSTLRQHRLLREQNVNSSSLPFPISNGRSPPSPNSPTSSSSTSPSALTSLSLSSLALKPSVTGSLEFVKERNKTEPKMVTLEDSD